MIQDGRWQDFLDSSISTIKTYSLEISKKGLLPISNFFQIRQTKNFIAFSF